MSHVDEGTLHAWLDGALDALPGAEAQRVREHLASCAACRGRLEEERAIRQEAADILGGAAPGMGDAPAFEELRARAEARERPRPAPLRLYRWGWAASVVLALGVGWMLRDASVPDFGRAGPGAPAPEATEEEADATRARQDALERATERATEPATERPAEGATEDVMEDVMEDAAGAATEVERRASGAALGTRAPGAAPRPKAEGDAASAPQATAKASPQEAPQAGAVSPAARVQPIPEPDHPILPEWSWLRDAPALVAVPDPRFDTLEFPRTAFEVKEAITAASRNEADAPMPLRDSLFRGGGLPAASLAGVSSSVRRPAEPTGDEAVRLGATALGRAPAPPPSLRVPGLEVLSTTRLDAEGLAGAIRVRQLMQDGDTLEIVHLPVEVPPSRLDPVEDGRTELVLPRPDGWLVVRARADQGTLRQLVRSMAGGG